MGFLGKLHRDLWWRGGILTIKHNFEFYISLRHKIDQEPATWLKMEEAQQYVQAQKQNHNLVTPTDAVSQLVFTNYYL